MCTWVQLFSKQNKLIIFFIFSLHTAGSYFCVNKVQKAFSLEIDQCRCENIQNLMLISHMKENIRTMQRKKSIQKTELKRKKVFGDLIKKMFP
jgi:hypothetical protein